MNPQNKKQPYRVLCLGNVLADILVKPVDVLPTVGGLLAVDHIGMAIGGCASNTAVVLSRLGVPTSLWGKLGRDLFGDFVLKELKRAGVETSGLVIDKKTDTSATLVLVNSKAQRSFLHSMAANDLIYKKELRLSKLSQFRHLHVGGYFLFSALDGKPMADILKQAKGKGVTTSLDTAWDLRGRWMKTLKPCLPYLDFFMPSEREVKMLLGYTPPAKAARAFLKLGAGAVIIKRGEKGSYFLNREGMGIQVPAYRAKVVDTTGAGDCFCAGVIKGLSLGWNMKRCLQLGNAAGARAVEALGATAGIQSFQQVSTTIKNT